MTTFSEIRYDVEDGVCTVTLNRPDRLNAVTATMLRELGEAWDRADADDAVRVVIVTGAGRAFCAGADLGAGGGTFVYRRAADHRDGGGIVRIVSTGCRDETAARQILADLERTAQLVRSNVITAAEEQVMVNRT